MTIRIVIQQEQLTKKASGQIYPRIKAQQRWEFAIITNFWKKKELSGILLQMWREWWHLYQWDEQFRNDKLLFSLSVCIFTRFSLYITRPNRVEPLDPGLKLNYNWHSFFVSQFQTPAFRIYLPLELRDYLLESIKMMLSLDWSFPNFPHVQTRN